LVALFENSETTNSAKPKEKLEKMYFDKIKNKTREQISEPFKKLKDLKKYAQNNVSLKEFVADLEIKLL